MSLGQKLEDWWDADECSDEIHEIIEEVKALQRSKDGAYSERDNLVAALSKLFPASLERHDPSDTTWEDDWRWIVFIELPTGQASWHIHNSELPMFDHLIRETGIKWDGHTTEEKYDRLAQIKPRFKTIQHFREGQTFHFSGEQWILKEIKPYGLDDYWLGLERGSHYKAILLSTYNDLLNKESA